MKIEAGVAGGTTTAGVSVFIFLFIGPEVVARFAPKAGGTLVGGGAVGTGVDFDDDFAVVIGGGAADGVIVIGEDREVLGGDVRGAGGDFAGMLSPMGFE